MEEIFCIAAFRSRLQVMAFEEALHRGGVKAEIVTTPRAVSLGCGLSVRFELRDLDRARALCRQMGTANLIGFYRVTRERSGRTQVQPV